jgi:hypothetical protein
VLSVVVFHIAIVYCAFITVNDGPIFASQLARYLVGLEPRSATGQLSSSLAGSTPATQPGRHCQLIRLDGPRRSPWLIEVG